MPIVTPNPTRRSTRTIVRPTRLGDDSSVRESTGRNAPPEHDLMADVSAEDNAASRLRTLSGDANADGLTSDPGKSSSRERFRGGICIEGVW